MPDRTPEFRWYLVGCARLGHAPLPEAEFSARWQEFEDHAEKLKATEATGSAPDVDARTRAEMRERFKTDPLVDAVLVGMAESGVMGDSGNGRET